jgi:hypothetical protein
VGMNGFVCVSGGRSGGRLRLCPIRLCPIGLSPTCLCIDGRAWQQQQRGRTKRGACGQRRGKARGQPARDACRSQERAERPRGFRLRQRL